MWHSFIERAALKALTGGRTSGKMGDTDGYTTIQAVEEFDFADQEATKRELDAFCESYQYAPEEHALVLSPTGKLYRLDGWSASVNTDLVGEDALKGATVIHNHPTTKEEGFYDSFSQQDIISAVQSKTGLEIVVSGKHIHAVFIDEDMSIERMNELYSTAQNRVRDRAIRTDNPIEFEQLEILEELSRMGVLQFVRIRG